MRDDEQFPNSESNSDADIQHLNQESGRSEEDVLKTSLNRPEMVEVLDAPFDTAQSTVNKASTAEEKTLAEDHKLKEHSGQETEKTRAQLEKKALKREKWERKRKSVVPVYKWFFVWLLLLFLPIVNIFLIIYWGFFSDRINRNIRNAILGAILLVVVATILSVIAYFYPNFMDPRISQIFNEFFTGLSDLFATVFDRIGALISGKVIN